MNPDFLEKLQQITAALRSGLTLGGNPLGELQKRATQIGDDFGSQIEQTRAQAGYAKAHPESARAQQEMLSNAAMMALQMGKGGERPSLVPAIKTLGDVPAGADPTAAWQAQVWGGIGRADKTHMMSVNNPSFHEILDRLLKRSATLWNVTPGKANELFWKGQPLDLPLDASLLNGPARLRKK